MAHEPVKVSSVFYESLHEVDESEETVGSLRALTLIAAARPQYGELVRKMDVRALKTGGRGAFQPYRLFYWVDEDDTIYLLEVDTYF